MVVICLGKGDCKGTPCCKTKRPLLKGNDQQPLTTVLWNGDMEPSQNHVFVRPQRAHDQDFDKVYSIKKNSKGTSGSIEDLVTLHSFDQSWSSMTWSKRDHLPNPKLWRNMTNTPAVWRHSLKSPMYLRTNAKHETYIASSGRTLLHHQAGIPPLQTGLGRGPLANDLPEPAHRLALLASG